MTEAEQGIAIKKVNSDMKFLKRLFCKHDYEYKYLHMVHGSMAKLYRCTCKKCGKVVYKTL